MEKVSICDEAGQAIEVVGVGQPIKLIVEILAHQDVPELVLGYVIKDRLGQAVFGTNTHHLDNKLERISAGSRMTYSFSFPANLGVGSYSISAALHTADTHISQNYEWRDLAAVFDVINVDKGYFVGVNWLPPIMECKR